MRRAKYPHGFYFKAFRERDGEGDWCFPGSCSGTFFRSSYVLLHQTVPRHASEVGFPTFPHKYGENSSTEKASTQLGGGRQFGGHVSSLASPTFGHRRAPPLEMHAEGSRKRGKGGVGEGDNDLVER